MRKVVLSAAAITVSALLWWGGSAYAQPPTTPIQPNQFFNGLVNGSGGSAVIKMACFGPIRPGQLGHPMAGQSVNVFGPLQTGAGFTGRATSIDATLSFSIPPSPTSVAVQLALFQFYNQPAPISTELEFPCGGMGQVVFDPVKGGRSAKAAILSVSFVGQP
jgi:hypothetical protein